MKQLQDFSDMFIPTHSAFEEEKLDPLTKWIIAVFFILLAAGICVSIHYGFNVQ